MAQSINPLKQIFNIRKEELPMSLFMGGIFFLVITVFWIMKPIKKTLFLSFYKDTGFDLMGIAFTASQTELLAKVLNMVVAFFAVWIFSILSNKFRREKLIFIFATFFMATLLVFSQLISNESAGVYWSFYLYGDLFSTLMVATFFAFLNDSVTPGASKRLYGLIGFGGVVGGAFSTTTLRTLQKAKVLSNEEFLLVCIGLVFLIMVFAYFAGKLATDTPSQNSQSSKQEKSQKSNAAFEGAKLVLTSKYFLSIVLIVGLYEMVSTIMEFQFTNAILNLVPGPEIGNAFNTAFMSMNVLAMVVQLFLTSFVMTRFGVGKALMVLPIAVCCSSMGFMLFPLAITGGLLLVLDGGFNYSINQMARESLYVPTTRDEKYKAKAFIDMFLQRFAKVLAIGLSLGVSFIFTDFAGIRYLSTLKSENHKQKFCHSDCLLILKYIIHDFHHLKPHLRGQPCPFACLISLKPLQQKVLQLEKKPIAHKKKLKACQSIGISNESS